MHLQNIPENKHQQFNSTEDSKQSRLSKIQKPSHGPSPLPTPSQKQKHVTSGSICLTPPAVREGSQPPRTTECHLQLWGPATPEHTLTQGTFSNRIKYQEVGGNVLLLKMKKKKVPSSKSISQTLYNRRSIAVTYMGTYRVELYKASRLTGHRASDCCFSYTQWKYRIEPISVSRVRSSTSSWQHLID